MRMSESRVDYAWSRICNLNSDCENDPAISCVCITTNGDWNWMAKELFSLPENTYPKLLKRRRDLSHLFTPFPKVSRGENKDTQSYQRQPKFSWFKLDLYRAKELLV